MRILDRLLSLPTGTRLVLAVAGLLATAGGAGLWGADVEQASLFLMLGVVFGALLGRVTGAVSAIFAALILNFAFTPPRGTLRVGTADDAIALVVFAIVAAIIGTVVAAVSDYRRSAERRAREAVLTLDLAARLRGGEDPAAVTTQAAAALVELFGFARAELTAGEIPTASRPWHATLSIESPAVRLDAVVAPDHPLSDDDRAVLESLVFSLSAAMERISAERAAEAARVAAEVSRTRAGFLSAVSHNLRTPLAAIRASASALLSDAGTLTDAERAELIETVHAESIRLENLVAKLLDLGRIRAGGLELVPERVDLAGLTQAAVHRLRPLLGAHQVTLDFDADLDDVELDPAAIEQVLVNLLENALRYAGDATPIEISARRVRGVVELRVIDHGPGVPVEERERVFEEFYRSGRRDESDGTGLGLAIVNAIVAAHRGRAYVEATAGGGATFVVRLPRVVE